MRRSIAVFALAGALAACGGSTTMRAEGTARAPAAKADMELELEGSHNDLDVRVSNLVAPETIDEDFSRYGVWMIRRDGTPSFLGFLRYQSDIRYGDLETQTPLEPVEIVVTAETREPGREPSDAVIVRRALPALP